MHGNRRLLTAALGVLLFATGVFALLAAPGFLTDLDTTVPAAPTREAGR